MEVSFAFFIFCSPSSGLRSFHLFRVRPIPFEFGDEVAFCISSTGKSRNIALDVNPIDNIWGNDMLSANSLTLLTDPDSVFTPTFSF
jgi:hypothetical protein